MNRGAAHGVHIRVEESTVGTPLSTDSGDSLKHGRCLGCGCNAQRPFCEALLGVDKLTDRGELAPQFLVLLRLLVDLVAGMEDSGVVAPA